MYPLHLDVSPEQAMFLDTSRKLLETQSPLTEVRRLAEIGAGFDRQLWARQAALGWYGLLVPEEHGGGSLSGHGLVNLAIVANELGRLVQPGPVLPTALVGGALSGDTSSRHADSLERLVAGELPAAWCAPGAELVATPGGPGYVLDGTVRFVQDADLADVLLVTATTPSGLMQFLAAAAVDGLTIEPLESLDLARRLCHVRFDSVALSGDAVVGRSSRHGATAAQLLSAVALQNAETVGALDRVFEFTLDYAKDRLAFGRPIGSYQAIKHRLADLLTTLESAKATAMAAVVAVASDDEAAPELVSVAKSFIGRAGPTLVQDCVQIHGGIGVTWEHDIHLYLRRVVTNTALYGTPADHERHLATLLAQGHADG